jgi:hypothetical protein
MHELAQRHAELNMKHEEHRKAILHYARSLTTQEAQQLLAGLQRNPQDVDTYWTLVRHYEFKVDVKGLDALRLWYIEHQPGGNVWAGNIDPNVDSSGYQEGKTLWLVNLRQSDASAIIYQRAADFLEGADKSLAESVLLAGQKAYPNDERWPRAFGRHYAQALLGSVGPLTEYNVIRHVSSQGVQSAYTMTVRTQLAGSRDAPVLAQTAQWLLVWGNSQEGKEERETALRLAHAYVERALFVEPQLVVAQSAKMRLAQAENRLRLAQLRQMSPAQLATGPASDQMLLVLDEMDEASMRQKFSEAKSKAQKVLDLAVQHRDGALYGEAIFDANMTLGKAAFRHGDTKAAAHYLLAAAETPGCDGLRRGDFDMNLPRALVDRGQRSVVVDFFQRIAPETTRAKVFREWAVELSKGINPDLFPVFFAPGCSNDPC